MTGQRLFTDERQPSWLEQLWDDLTSRARRDDLQRLSRRVAALEKAARANSPAPQSPSAPPADEAAEQRAATERTIEMLKVIQRETTVRLNALHAALDGALKEGHTALGEVRAMHEALEAKITAWQSELTAFPARWQADLEARITALRETPDAANAALLGVESFTASIAAQLREDR